MNSVDQQQSAVKPDESKIDPNYECDQGASLTFTYKEGLVV